MARLTPRQWKRRYNQPRTLRAIHRRARNVDEYLRWLHGWNGYLRPKDPAKGFRVAEHPDYGGVHPTAHSGSAAEGGPSNHYARPDKTWDLNVGDPGTSDKEVRWLARWERLVRRWLPYRELIFADADGFNRHAADGAHRTHGHCCVSIPRDWREWRRSR